MDTMNTFGARLKSERTRLGLSQEAFGEACGRGNIMQMKYEKGSGFPDVPYLLKAAELGVDIHFLLTSRYAVQSLPEDETLLLASYRAQTAQGKAGVLGTLSGLAGVAAQGTRGNAIPAAILREWRIVELLRSVDDTQQTIFEEFIRNIAAEDGQSPGA